MFINKWIIETREGQREKLIDLMDELIPGFNLRLSRARQVSNASRYNYGHCQFTDYHA